MDGRGKDLCASRPAQRVLTNSGQSWPWLAQAFAQIAILLANQRATPRRCAGPARTFWPFLSASL